LLEPKKRRHEEHGDTEIERKEIAGKEPGAETGKCVHPGKNDEKKKEDSARRVSPFFKGEIDEADYPGQKKEEKKRSGWTVFIEKERPDHIQSGLQFSDLSGGFSLS